MSSLDAEQRVAVLPLCDCSPEPHEPSSDRVVVGKVLLLQSLGWDMAARTQPQEQWRLPRHQLHHPGVCHGVVPVPEESFLENGGLSMQSHSHLWFQGSYLPIAPPRVRRT